VNGRGREGALLPPAGLFDDAPGRPPDGANAPPFDFGETRPSQAAPAAITVSAADRVEARRVARSMGVAGVLALLAAIADGAVTAIEGFLVGVSATTCGSSVAAVFAATLGVILLLSGRTFRRIGRSDGDDGSELVTEGISRLRSYLLVKAVAFGAVLALTCCLLGAVIGIGAVMAASAASTH
jgi:hypothetical protein